MAKHIKWGFPGEILNQAAWVEGIQGFEHGARDVGGPVFAWRSHVQHGERLAGGHFAVEFTRED